jgi:hypothetical protein
MFAVAEADAAAVRRVFEQDGKLSAMIKLRRRFPGITDDTRARECARIIGRRPAVCRAKRPRRHERRRR